MIKLILLGVQCALLMQINASGGKIDELVVKPEPTSPIRKSDAECKKYAAALPTDIGVHVPDVKENLLGEFPHMAALGYKADGNISWGLCTGSLISYQYVLTVAHCVINRDGITPSLVRLGNDLVGNSDKVPPTDYEVERYIVHHNYSVKTKENDIALLKLKQSVQNQPNISPCCLYTKDDNPTGLIGTRWSENDNGSSRIIKSAMNSVDASTCREIYSRGPFPKAMPESQLCVNDHPDSCMGNAGSPVQILNEGKSNIYSVVGIASYGKRCESMTPSVYTRVSSYLDWIESIVWP